MTQPPSVEATQLQEPYPERKRRKERPYFPFSAILIGLVVANLLAFYALHLQRAPSSSTLYSNSKAFQSRSLIQQEQIADDASLYSLKDLKILVAICAYDFSQMPHLEEVLDGYHDTCIAGANVRVVLHTTVAWPVSFLDMLQTRFPCPNFELEFILKLPRVKLHLADYHRKLFYDRIDEYDLFIYTEDDIRVTPSTIATYMEETNKIARILESSDSNIKQQYTASDFNVGIVRYEYNFPSNVIIDDSTRKATENVTRVYWEHSSFQPPIIPNAVDTVPQEPFRNNYVHMKNHHQGLYLATQSLLKAWKERPGCQFDVASNRPGRANKPSQPLFGTQRVWMSSQQLYGSKFGCGVQQVIPLDQFGALTVHHLPNKNYRRVRQYRTRDMVRDEGVVVEDEHLLTALQLHLALVRAYPPPPKDRVRIQMYPDPENPTGRTPPEEWKPKLEAFDAYVARGGNLSEEDWKS